MGRELKEAVQESMIVSITALELQMCGLGWGEPSFTPRLGAHPLLVPQGLDTLGTPETPGC